MMQVRSHEDLNDYCYRMDRHGLWIPVDCSYYGVDVMASQETMDALIVELDLGLEDTLNSMIDWFEWPEDEWPNGEFDPDLAYKLADQAIVEWAARLIAERTA